MRIISLHQVAYVTVECKSGVEDITKSMNCAGTIWLNSLATTQAQNCWPQLLKITLKSEGVKCIFKPRVKIYACAISKGFSVMLDVAL